MTSLVLPDLVTPHFVADVTSTNDVAKGLAREGAPEFTLVYADRQSAGRGRMQREWHSPTGNLFMSLVLRAQPNWPALPTLSHMAALAIRDVVGPLAGLNSTKIKWPNDVLVDGAKLAGILIEREADAAVLGIGVNIRHHPDDLPYPATALNQMAPSVDRDQFLSLLIPALLGRFATWQAAGFAGLRDDYLGAAYRLGERIEIQAGAADRRVSGIYQGIDATGQLLLQREGGVEVHCAGDVLAT